MMGRLLGLFLRRGTASLWLLALLLCVVVLVTFWSLNPLFVSGRNLSSLFVYMPQLGIMTLSMTLLLAAGHFDLSIGAVFGFASMCTFLLFNDHYVPFWLALVAGVMVGALVGLANGIFVAVMGFSSLLVTLSTGLAVTGMAELLTNGQPTSSATLPSYWLDLGNGTISFGTFAVPAVLVWFLALALLTAWLLQKTRVGNWILAVGGNRQSAEARGINARSVLVWLFIYSGVTAALAGILSDTIIGSAYPLAGSDYALPVIAMCVIGGTSLYGGTATVLGSVLGALLLSLIENGVTFIGVPALAYDVAVGCVILVAIASQSALGGPGKKALARWAGR